MEIQCTAGAIELNRTDGLFGRNSSRRAPLGSHVDQHRHRHRCPVPTHILLHASIAFIIPVRLGSTLLPLFNDGCLIDVLDAWACGLPTDKNDVVERRDTPGDAEQ